MTDLTKKTRRQQATDARAIDALDKGSMAKKVLDTVSGTEDLVRYTAARFNSLRAQLAALCDLLRNQDKDAMKYVIMSKALAQGDYGLLLDEETVPPSTYEVEDAAEFTKRLAEIYATKRYDTRMSICVNVSRQIGEAIARLESKLDKMASMSSIRGATQGELDVAACKRVQFSEAIKVLRKRGSVVCEAYYEARKQVTDFVEKANSEFVAINYNEEGSGK